MTTKRLGQITNKSLVFCLLVFLSLVFCPSTFTLFQFKDDKLKNKHGSQGWLFQEVSLFDNYSMEIHFKYSKFETIHSHLLILWEILEMIPSFIWALLEISSLCKYRLMALETSTATLWPTATQASTSRQQFPNQDGISKGRLDWRCKFYWSSFKWWRTDGSWDQRWMVWHPRFKDEKVTMVIKIIIGTMISSQMSYFGHLWHAHPQRWACYRCPE